MDKVAEELAVPQMSVGSKRASRVGDKTIGRGRRFAKRAKEKGNALLGMAMALIISAVVAAGYLVFFNTANDSAKVNDFMGQLAAMQTAVQSLYYGQATYTGLDTAVVATSGTLPAKMISANTIKHPFNDDITIAPGSTGSTYVITADRIPEDSCTALMTKDLGRSLVNMHTDQDATGVDKRAMTPAEAQAACTDASDGVITITSYG